MQRIGIVYREGVPAAEQLAWRLVAQLRLLDLSAWAEGAATWHAARSGAEHDDAIIVLGGDGTILSTARQCAVTGTPLLGINFGHVGFLAELEPEAIEAELPQYLAGNYWVDERSMLGGTLTRDHVRTELLSLNDIVVVRGAQPRVVRLRVWINDSLYTTYSADGIIIATATGSTAYNLAAGGPILHPSVRGSVLTAVASHLAADRPLVLDPEAEVRLELEQSSSNALLSADGQITYPFNAGDSVTVKMSALQTRFLRRRSPNHFYRALIEKLSMR